jgi:alkylation response protein AidB-like acyl-CoA dehydrogenase
MDVATTSLERAEALYDLISGEARESELAGRLTDRVAPALLDANLFSMLVDRSNGRLEASRADFFETVEAISKADGSAGWRRSVCASTAFVISKAARAAVKREVFGDGPVGSLDVPSAARNQAPSNGLQGFRAFRLGIGKFARPRCAFDSVRS